jgi:hypothetical protein
VLYILIPTLCFVFLALAFLGLTLCRLAARSDASDATALAQWIETSELARAALASRRATATLEMDEADGARRAAS